MERGNALTTVERERRQEAAGAGSPTNGGAAAPGAGAMPPGATPAPPPPLTTPVTPASGADAPTQDDGKPHSWPMDGPPGFIENKHGERVVKDADGTIRWTVVEEDQPIERVWKGGPTWADAEGGVHARMPDEVVADDFAGREPTFTGSRDVPARPATPTD